jgi:hypothetical protein
MNLTDVYDRRFLNPLEAHKGHRALPIDSFATDLAGADPRNPPSRKSGVDLAPADGE